MKYLTIYENWRNDKMEGYVINGLYFMGGFKEKFLKPSKNLENMLKNVLLGINQKYEDEIYSDIVGIWLQGLFSLKWGKWIPAYSFQVPCKTKEGAIKIANELVTEFKSIIDNPVCIAISGGEIMINYNDLYNCDGEAYIKSGRFIDNLRNCQKMIIDGVSIKIL